MGVIGGESAGRNHAMDMRVKLELLVPGVQHAEEADLRTEMSGIAGDFQKCFGTGPEQQTIDDLCVPERQWCQLTRQREDHMDVTRREKFRATCCNPPFPGRSLTLRAVAIPTAVIGDGGAMSAAGALIEMTAKCGGATPRDGQ